MEATPPTYTVRVQAFEGPLDVLLGLIEGKKLEITRISLAEVTNQFINYVREVPLPPGMIADFIAVAARLLIIKTKALLPFLVLSEEEEEELVDLELRLKLLQQFRDAGKHLRRLERKKQRAFGREAATVFSVAFYPPENVTAETLHACVKRITEEFRAFFAKQQYAGATLEKVVSLQERIRDLMRLVEGAIEQHFHEVVRDAKTKGEIIVTFLAMLELVKMKLISVDQGDMFGDIVIRKFSSETAPAVLAAENAEAD